MLPSATAQHTPPAVCWQFVCGTGHRTLSEDADEAWAREKLFRCAEWLRDQRGTLVVLSGMARGFDLWWADTIAQTAGLELWACIPFEEQTAPWSTAERREWERLMGLAQHTNPFPVRKLPTGLTGRQRSAVVNKWLFERNIDMLDISDAVATLWEPGRLDGGTAGVLQVAAKRRMPGVHIDPRGQRVHPRLPDLNQLVKHTLVHRECGHVAATGTAADVQTRHAEMPATSRGRWRVRRARPREQRGTGCRTCRPVVDLPAKKIGALL
jgi:hypothetical protein